MRTPAGAAGLAVAVLLAGCGDYDGGGTSEKERYEDAVAGVDRATQPAEDRADDQLEGAESLPEQANAIDAMQRAMLELVAGLDRIDPPAEVASAHEDWVEGLRLFAEEDLEAAEGAARARDRRRVREIMQRGFASPETLERIGRAREVFEREGYEIGNLGEGP